MEIRSIGHKPGKKYISPSIRFPISLRYTELQEAIIKVSGWLEVADGKIIAKLEEEPMEATAQNGIGARGSKYDNQFKAADFETVLVASLDSRALDYIEKMRMKDEKRDVRFTLDLIVRGIDTKALISHVHLVNQRDLGIRATTEILTGSRTTRDYRFLVYARDSGFYPDDRDRWLVSGDGSPIFLVVTRQTLKKAVTIRSSDWIHDYAPVLQLGEYFIVEIPKGDKTIEQGWKYIDKAEESFRDWKTKDVYANCREAGALLDRTIGQKFRKKSFIYKERWGRAYGRFEKAASLNLHLEDIRQRYPEEDIIISRTDAEHILITTKTLIKLAEELIREGG